MAAGAPEPAAELISDLLVSANLRGVDSHRSSFCPFTRLSRATLIRVREPAEEACDHAVRLADELALGFVTVRNSNHFGAAAYWGSRMEAAGKIGIVFCDASPLVAPWQGKQSVMGTNPICAVVPGPGFGNGHQCGRIQQIYDEAMTNAPSIPEGWALNAFGASACKPAEALKGSVMPLRGQVAGFQGSGLAAAR